MPRTDAQADVTLRLHGLPAMSQWVLASVFAAKLAVLIRAMKKADRRANGGTRHDYLIVELAAESALAALRETRTSKKPVRESSIKAFGNCLDAIRNGDARAAYDFADCVESLASFCRGVEKKYSHADLIVRRYTPIRVDAFFEKQVTKAAKRAGANEESGPRYFQGAARGAFDGTIKEVDLRGESPRVKLVLAAGGREIDCICVGIEIDDLRQNLDRRVWAEGRAYYEGEGGLPTRLEIVSIRQARADADLARWRGSFAPFELHDIE